jgi:hypothetical protein
MAEVSSPKTFGLRVAELLEIETLIRSCRSEGYKSPYYKDSHRALQKYMRQL